MVKKNYELRITNYEMEKTARIRVSSFVIRNS